MNSIESITKKIIQDANTVASEKIIEAQQEAKTILDEYKSQADKIRTDAKTSSLKEAEALSERVESQSALSKRNMILQNKRLAISNAFEKALESFCSMEESKQLAFLSDAAAKYQSQDAEVILNSKDRSNLASKLLPMIQEKLAANGKTYKIKLSNTIGNFSGGLILVEGSIETNISYEVLIKNIRDDIESEVAKILYE